MRSGEEPPQWKDLVSKSSQKSTDEHFALASEWTPDYFKVDESQIDSPHPVGNDSVFSSSPSNVTSVTFENGNTPSEGATNSSSSEPDKALLMPTLPDLNELTNRRSSRHQKVSEKATLSDDSTVQKIFGTFCSVSPIVPTQDCLLSKLPSTATQIDKHINHIHTVNTLFDGTLNTTHHTILNTSTDEISSYCDDN